MRTLPFLPSSLIEQARRDTEIERDRWHTYILYIYVVRSYMHCVELFDEQTPYLAMPQANVWVFKVLYSLFIFIIFSIN
jgi:hypothetical protein